MTCLPGKEKLLYIGNGFLGVLKQSEQQILTLTIPQFEFVYLIPIKYPDTQKIKEMFDLLEAKLGDDFLKVFEAILTDRDCKFNDFTSIEVNDLAVVRTRIFSVTQQLQMKSLPLKILISKSDQFSRKACS